MRAIHITETGGPDVLNVTEIDRPSPGPGEILIEVAAAGVNFIDTYQRGGLYPMELPFTPGLECAGTVVEVGDGVDDFAIGDRVAASAGGGSYAEFRTVSVETAIPVPDTVELETAAAVLLQGMTAHYLAVDTLTIGLSKELGAAGVRVDAVRPGLIERDIHASGGEPGRIDRLKGNIPQGRGGTPDEVARLILWLASDEASYVNGALIDVSGGR